MLLGIIKNMLSSTLHGCAMNHEIGVFRNLGMELIEEAVRLKPQSQMHKNPRGFMLLGSGAFALEPVPNTTKLYVLTLSILYCQSLRYSLLK